MGTGLTGRLPGCSLPLKALVLLLARATAELVPRLQTQPWAPASTWPPDRERRQLPGAWRAAFNDVLTQMVCSAVMKAVPATLCPAPAVFVLFG